MTYRFSRKAAEDLENLYVFGAQTFGVAHSERYYAGLMETLAFLDTYPQVALPRPELGPDTRAWPHKAHVIFYRIDAAGILVQRIPHGREDWERS